MFRTMKYLLDFLLLCTQLYHVAYSFNCDSCDNANVCDTVTGTFRITEMGRGYHPVVTVPRGACFINVTELGDTANVLALKDVDSDKYVFNGQWLMDGSGNYPAVGTIFSYMKDEQNCPGECIRATGPILAPIIIQLLYHERNPGVKFSYKLPKRINNLPAYRGPTDDDRKELRDNVGAFRDISEEAENVVGTFPKFVPLPGPSGIHHRGPIFSSDFKYRRQNGRERTRNKNKFANVVDSRASRGDRRSLTDVTFSRGLGEDRVLLETRASNEIGEVVDVTREVKANSLETEDGGSGDEIPYVGHYFAWTLSYHTNCTRPCGGGITNEVYQCTSLGNHSAVEDVYCNALQKPEVHHKVCNSEPCTPHWKVGVWSACSVSCGQGVQSRDITCVQRISAIDTQELDDVYCTSSKPAGRKLCYAESCYSWYLGEWSECSVQCGRGDKNREVRCQDRLGNGVNDTMCSHPVPESKKECVLNHCSSDWYYTPWYGKCSADCGNGVVTRRVHCVTKDGQVLDNHYCDSTTMPSAEKQCRTDTKCGGRWFTGPWSECSQACGRGNMTRRVVCIKHDGDSLTILDDTGCDMDEKPKQDRECTANECVNATWYRTDWSKCSQSCDGGVQTRSVRCMTDTHQPSTECEDQDRPEVTNTCNTDKCRTRKPNRRARCTDRYPNCGVVVQAKLCRYPYYQRKCCKSCSGLKRLY